MGRTERGMLRQDNPVASVLVTFQGPWHYQSMCVRAPRRLYARTAHTFAESVSSYSWCKCAGCQQAGVWASCVWVGAILLPGGDSSPVRSAPREGRAGKETGRGRGPVSGSWEPERERPKGQQGSAIPSSANSLALDKISQHSVSLRIVREQSQTFRSTSQAPEPGVLFSLFHTPQTSALKDTGAFASDLPSNLACQQPGSCGHPSPPPP